VRGFGIRVILIEPPYVRTRLDSNAAQAERRIDAYAAQRRRTAAAITRNTDAGLEPEVIAGQVLRAIEGRYRMRRQIGQAALLNWLRRLLPARMFEPSLRKAFALDPSSKIAGTRLPQSALTDQQHARFHRNGYHGGADGHYRQRLDHFHGHFACCQDCAGGGHRHLDRSCRRSGASRVAPDLQTDSRRRTVRDGAACRGGVREAWPAARTAVLSIPLPVMIALNVARVFAVLFLMLAAEGRLSGPFPYSAARGDIITGAAAVPLLLKDGGARHATAIAVWNLFGAADLVLAIGFGVTSAEGSPLQLFAAPGSEAMQHAPWSIVPTVLVPIWLILHAIIAVNLRSAKLRQDVSVVA
jgi:hypothetical protein